MAKVTIYSTQSCSYCIAAKAFLDGRGVAYESIDVTDDPAARAALVRRANGMRTVPQIFIGERHIGGFTDMRALDQKGELEPLLKG